MSTGIIYPSAFSAGFTGQLTWAGNNISCALMDSAFTLTSTPTTWSNLSANEISGTGYTTGGAVLANPQVNVTQANVWTLTWAASTGYTAGSVVRPTTGNGYLYMVISGSGNSSTTQPTWPTVIGESVVDGAVTWVCAGTAIVVWTGDPISWGNSSFTAYGAVFYSTQGGGPTADPVFGGILFSAAETTPTAGTFVLNPDPNLGFFFLLTQ